MLAGLDEITCLVDHAWLTNLKKILNLCYRDFLLPLETACTALGADTLDGDESLLTLYAYAYSALRNRTEITLSDAGCLLCKRLEVACNQEFSFDFLCHVSTRFQVVCQTNPSQA